MPSAGISSKVCKIMCLHYYIFCTLQVLQSAFLCLDERPQLQPANAFYTRIARLLLCISVHIRYKESVFIIYLHRLEICQKIYTTEDFRVKNLHRKRVIFDNC